MTTLDLVAFADRIMRGWVKLRATICCTGRRRAFTAIVGMA
jgi:hypothetical protein